MLVDRTATGITAGLDQTERRGLNNSFAWLCHGTHVIENDTFEREFGAPRSEFLVLLARIGESLDSGHRAIALSWAEVELVRRCLDAMLSGPSALSGAQYGTHDWELLSVSEDEFQTLRSQFHEITENR